MAVSAMAKIWASRLVAGTQKFEDCPIKYKDDVIVLLKDEVKRNKISADRFLEITGTTYEA